MYFPIYCFLNIPGNTQIYGWLRLSFINFTRKIHTPGKNTGVGCHFLLQCMKVKCEREVAQSCPTLTDTGRQLLLSWQVNDNVIKPTEVSRLIPSGINPDITTWRITIFSHSLSQAAILQLHKPETQNSFLTPPLEVGWPQNSLFKPSRLGE